MRELRRRANLEGSRVSMQSQHAEFITSKIHNVNLTKFGDWPLKNAPFLAHCIACTLFLCGCARRCLLRRMACTCFLCGCARRCPSRRIACTGFFRGCACVGSLKHIKLIVFLILVLVNHSIQALAFYKVKGRDIWSASCYSLRLVACAWHMLF